MRGLLVAAIVVGLSPASYADPAKPAKNAGREWKAKRAAKPLPRPTLAMSSKPSPARIFQVAQAYRLKGDRAKAVELYSGYLEVAPRGAAANACRAELEKLLDVP
jgi:hypothetical protein